jgi:RNA polymerase sigma-70 factor (ECF subfamily)
MRVLANERARFVRMARRYVATDADAEDVVQRALLRASTRAESLEDPARAGAWFHRIVRHAIVDYHRARAADPLLRASVVDDSEEPAGADLAPGAHAPCECAVRLLDQLRPAYAEVLRKVDLAGADPAEVAAALHISPGNLNVRLHRARRALRSAVEEHCGVHSGRPCLDCTCDRDNCCSGPRGISTPRGRAPCP